jgi:hypothetical protein
MGDGGLRAVGMDDVLYCHYVVTHHEGGVTPSPPNTLKAVTVEDDSGAAYFLSLLKASPIRRRVVAVSSGVPTSRRGRDGTTK